ncbi:hypothetical protein [Streptomyces violaceusniger]|uniref:Uncharacterized protein n=1 Tax=Streptomyces violaceusniger TaxID=68280 RepID=A0A4D4L205_STRVO|nr:hypothetical protein SVIO_027020 [Streptomyces violaceusniger]
MLDTWRPRTLFQVRSGEAVLERYAATRMAMTQAATAAGIDPDRLSLTTALHTVRLTVITANTTGPTLLTEVLLKTRNLAPASRRSRTSPRYVKRTLSPYADNKTKGRSNTRQP